MSDIENLTDRPSGLETRLEKALRNAVKETYNADTDQLTVKKLRTKVENALGLTDGFFKSDAVWNARSKEAAQEAQSQPQSSQVAPSQSPARRSKQQDTVNEKSNGKKRPATSNGGQVKRRKRSKPDEEILSESEETPVKAVTKTRDSPLASSNPLSDSDKSVPKVANNAIDQQDSESEMSVLIEEDPKRKKRAAKAKSEKPSSKKREGSKSAKVPQQPSDPDSEEIKRLQGWLIKCGIRKMWFRELAPYDTSKAKIRHLKDMLTEAGMTGRYSQEKATQIREERELKADIEAVQAGAKQWGRVSSDEEDGGRPRRKVAKGLQELDFLKDDDGEDSD
ncbi:MAG: hypothetical protein L6R35_000648 [Caloplaca aegaea]|nr:MAG: hypothetical protein L6R35_000648 [Caloplaca aegaea]